MSTLIEKMKEMVSIPTRDGGRIAVDVEDVTSLDGSAERLVWPGTISTRNEYLDGLADEMLKSVGIRGASIRVADVSRSVRHVPEKPSTSMLRNMASPEITGDSRQALAMEVEDKLGYTPLRDHAGAPSRLQRLLQELEIDAFDTKTVSQYKRQMRDHFQTLADERDGKESRRIQEAYGRDPMNAPLWLLRSMSTLVDWHQVPLASYTKPIPEFVLNKCVQIKDRAPEATFFVDELREDRRTLDPFMVVMLGQDSLAIEVWDEPEFEKTL